MRLSCSPLLLLSVLLGSCLVQEVHGQDSSDWPQWRGPDRSGVSDATGLKKSWPEGGPAVLWQTNRVGVGYSSLAVKDGRVFTQGDVDGVEHVIALSVEDGSVLWAVQPEPVAVVLNQRIEDEVKRLDQNGDGTIDEVEALEGLGWNFNDYDKPLKAEEDLETFSLARADRVFARLDQDKDQVLAFGEAGVLFRDEFARIDTAPSDADTEKLAPARTAEILKEFDADGDGKLSREEARRSPMERPFGRADDRDPQTNRGDNFLTAAEIDAYLRRFEAGKDGRITRTELADYYARKHPFGNGILSPQELRGFYGGYRNGMGDGPRGTPTVEGDRLYVEGGNGDLSCLDVATGKTLWHTNLRSELSGGRPGWGYSESPLIEGDLLIVTPGGKEGTLVALNKQDGTVVWRSGDVTQAAHYASPVAATIGGVRQIVQFARENVFGVRAEDGKLLWSYSAAANGTANCATPIVYQDHVFASSAYGTGGGLAKIVSNGGEQSAEEVYFDKRMANHHGGLVRLGDYLYGFGSGGLICMNFFTGEVAWRARSVNKGSLIAADGMLYLLGENHKVALAEATPEEYRERGDFQIESHGRPSWAHMAIADGKLFIRDQQSLTCYDISE